MKPKQIQTGSKSRSVILNFRNNNLTFRFCCIIFFIMHNCLGQTVIVNYLFNEQAPISYTIYDPGAILGTGITCDLTCTQPIDFTNTAGATTGAIANMDGFTFDAGSPNGAPRMANSSGTDNKFWTFHLSGPNIGIYTNFKIYFQAKRSNTGAQVIKISHKTNLTNYTSPAFAQDIPLNFTTGATGEFSISIPAASLNNLSKTDVYFQLSASQSSAAGTIPGTGDGNGTLYIDNFQVQAISACSAPNINVHPSTTSQSVCLNAAATPLSVTATGTSITYQWYQNATNSNSGGTSVGAGNGGQTNSYSPQTPAAGTWYYYCVVSGACAPVATSNVSGAVTVNPNNAVSVSIAAVPSGAITSGTNVTFTATPVNGGSTPFYQWRKNGGNVGINNGTYSDNALANNDVITCVLTSNVSCPLGNPATSNTITMVVTPGCTPPSISAQPSNASQSLCLNVAATPLSVSASGTAPISYQWYQNATNSNSGGTSVGASNGGQTNSYTPQTPAAGTFYYYCVVSGACAPVATSNVSGAVTVNPNNAVSVSIAAVPSGAITSGTNVTFTATPVNGGSTPSYLWKKNGGNVGANSSTYSNNTLANNDVITCVLTSNVSCPTGNPATSNAITMVVTPGCISPTTQSSGIVTSNVTCNSTTLTWSNGNGTKRIVVAKQGVSPTGTPVNGTNYTANATFGLGNTIAAGEYIVYNGTGNTVTVTGLGNGVTYGYTVFDYNCSPNNQYNTANATNNPITKQTQFAILVQTGPVSGTSVQCTNVIGQAYSISPIINATNYYWAVDASVGFITSGQGTPSITITTAGGAGTGNICVTVTSSNACNSLTSSSCKSIIIGNDPAATCSNDNWQWVERTSFVQGDPGQPVNNYSDISSSSYVSATDELDNTYIAFNFENEPKENIFVNGAQLAKYDNTGSGISAWRVQIAFPNHSDDIKVLDIATKGGDVFIVGTVAQNGISGDTKGFLAAFDIADGNFLWVRYSNPPVEAKNPGDSRTNCLTIRGDKIFIGGTFHHSIKFNHNIAGSTLDDHVYDFSVWPMDNDFEDSDNYLKADNHSSAFIAECDFDGNFINALFPYLHQYEIICHTDLYSNNDCDDVPSDVWYNKSGFTSTRQLCNGNGGVFALIRFNEEGVEGLDGKAGGDIFKLDNDLNISSAGYFFMDPSTDASVMKMAASSKGLYVVTKQKNGNKFLRAFDYSGGGGSYRFNKDFEKFDIYDISANKDRDEVFISGFSKFTNSHTLWGNSIAGKTNFIYAFNNNSIGTVVNKLLLKQINQTAGTPDGADGLSIKSISTSGDGLLYCSGHINSQHSYYFNPNHLCANSHFFLAQLRCIGKTTMKSFKDSIPSGADLNYSVIQKISAIGNLNNDAINASCTDGAGNVYLAINFSGASYNMGVVGIAPVSFSNKGGTNLTNDLIIAKYNASGNLLWAKQAGSTQDDIVTSMSCDNSGHVYMCGSYKGVLDFGKNAAGVSITASRTYLTSTRPQMFVAEYDAATGYIISEQHGNSSGYVNTWGNCVKADNMGNVYVCGIAQGNTGNIGFGSENASYTSANLIDIFLVRYSNNLSFVNWAKLICNAGIEIPNAITVDPTSTGFVHLTGAFNTTLSFGNGTQTLATSGANDIFLAKYDIFGNCQDAKSFGGSGHDIATGITTDVFGNIILGGYFRSPEISFGKTTLTNPHITFDNGLIAKFDNNYSALGAIVTNDEGQNRVSSICSDAVGNIYGTGFFQPPAVTSNFSSVENSGLSFLFTVKCDADLNITQSDAEGGQGSSRGNTICYSTNGDHLFVGGYFTDTAYVNNSDTTFKTFVTPDHNRDMLLLSYNSYVPPVSDLVEPTRRKGLENIKPEKNISINIIGKFSVYPNPTNGEFTLKIADITWKMADGKIDIYNTLGENVYSMQLTQATQFTINLSSQPEGIYLLKIPAWDKNYYQKILIKK